MDTVMKRLEGKVAVITGGTSGIGKEIALGFIKAGATVIVASRGAQRVAEMQTLFDSMGYRGCSLQVDISDRKSACQLMEHVHGTFGRLDILVNSAGYFPITNALGISREEWGKVVGINLDGAFWCAQAAPSYMVAQQYGRIIFITSGQGIQGVPLMAHYSAAKGGVIALARALAAEWGQYNITVNTIAPGPTATEHVRKDFPQEFLDKQAHNIALKRLGTPGDCTGLALLLASDEGAYITGTTIPVDGGIVNTILS